MSGVTQVGLTYVGDLPAGWKIVNAGAACKKVTDGTHDTPKVHTSGVPFITAIHIKNGSIDFSNCQYVDEETHRTIFSRCDPRKGDLTVVNIGAGVGECGYVDVDFEFSLKNVALLKPDPAALDGEFLFHLHQSRKLRIAHVVKAGGAQPFLSLAELRRLPIILPPLCEQKRIAAVLGTWDRAIETVEALIANARAEKQALMQQLLPQCTTPPKKRLPGFSGEWREAKLGSLADISKGEQKGRANLSGEGPVPVINGGITPSGYTDHPNTAANTITISEGGNSCGHVDLITQPFWCGGHCYALKNLKVDRDYLFAVLKYCERQVMSLRVGSGLPNIQKKALSQFSIPVPPKLEQVKIGELAAHADKEIAAQASQLTALRQERAALMQQLLTGKRRVKLPESEVTHA